ncbi:hypothetical protein HU200_066725 [Digitaria exilis]|uniref:Water stress and hypersensitive response domain-containing protein n=1 Tax=Digitaria exilis TaxID=1010633 RepID=A0A834ZZS6_9POAL|nr:hypothetical protein HU200_066725 [Digitaria exilis]
MLSGPATHGLPPRAQHANHRRVTASHRRRAYFSGRAIVCKKQLDQPAWFVALFSIRQVFACSWTRHKQTTIATMAKLVDKAKGFVADKVAKVEKPEAELSDVSLGHVGRDGATLASRIDVRNPYSHAIPVCEVSYSLKSAGREVASGTMPDPGSLVAGDTTRLDVPVKVPYDFLVSLARDAGTDWDIDYEMRVGLTVDLPIVGNLTLPLTKSGELKLPTLSSIF